MARGQDDAAREVSVPTVPTVVAAESAATGDAGWTSRSQARVWPAGVRRAGRIQDAEAVVNRGLVAAVAENEPVTAAKLAPAGTGGGLPPTIPNGMRAISIRVNEVVGVAGFVQPGAHVDVVAVVRGDTNNTVSRVVLTDTECLRQARAQTRCGRRQPPTPRKRRRRWSRSSSRRRRRTAGARQLRRLGHTGIEKSTRHQ